MADVVLALMFPRRRWRLAPARVQRRCPWVGILRGSPPLPKAVGKFGLRKLIETPDYIVKMPFPSSKSGQKVEMSRMQKMPT